MSKIACTFSLEFDKKQVDLVRAWNDLYGKNIKFIKYPKFSKSILNLRFDPTDWLISYFEIPLFTSIDQLTFPSPTITTEPPPPPPGGAGAVAIVNCLEVKLKLPTLS
jgi:hypothetical protein